MYGLLAHQEARMNSSFVELLRAEIGHSFVDMYEIEGGMDRLPNAFLPELQGRIRFGARMTAIDQSPTGVTLHYQTRAHRAQVSGDYAIITVPFSVLRHVEVLKPFAREAARHPPAPLRRVGQDPVPVPPPLLGARRRHFRRRLGDRPRSAACIILITGGDRARHPARELQLVGGRAAWGSLDPTERIVQALENVAPIHPQITEAFEVGASHMWHDDEFAGGAFVLFDPGQATLLHEHIVAPEGRIHFAGEHASLTHRWIQGAVESGLRAAYEIHTANDESSA
jgi:monoamine oxidase